MNKEHDNKARQDEAEEKRKTLAILAKSGEPFWLRVKKGDIAANKGDAMHRTFQGKPKCNFPTIQVCHGQYEMLTTSITSSVHSVTTYWWTWL